MGAKVNGVHTPLHTPLKNGDQVEIICSREQTPSPLWERFVVTGRARAEIVREVLGRAIAQRSRSSLRAAVERAWLALGGPACVENPTDLEDAEIFLDHLEASESAGALTDVAAFEESPLIVNRYQTR